MGLEAARPHPRSMGDERLIEALEGPDCALCSSVVRAGREYLEGILFESVTDVGFRERLLEGGGLCPRHAHVMVDIDRAQTETAVASAILLRSVLKARRAALEASRGPRRRSERVREAARPAWDCPACAQEATIGRHATERLAQHYAEDREWRVAIDRGGWCLAHPAGLERQLSSTERGLGGSFLDAQMARLTELDDRLDGLVQHSAFDRRASLTLDERRSVADALRTVAGRDG